MRYDICVIGGCSLDMMFYQKEDNTFNDNPDKSVSGGKASNQAVAASRAGAKVAIITRLGKDYIGDTIFKELQYNGVFTNSVEMVEGLKNDCAKIYIDNVTKDNTIKRENGAIDSFKSGMIDRYSSVLLNSKIIVAQMKAPKEFSERLINFCYEYKKPLIITPCRPEKLKISEGNNRELLDKITFITANKKECQTIFETDNIEECVRRYPNKLIVTLGEDGVIYHDGKDIQHIPAIKINNLVDTTGAGDTFNGNLAYCLTHGYTLKNAIERSQYASSMKVQVETAQAGMPYKEELDSYIRNYNLKENTYDEEFDLAYRVIIEAYEKIEGKKITRIDTKPDKSFVTEADLIVESVLIKAIKERFPTDNFVTEESNNQNKIKNRTWVIDPIDGTIHYMKDSIFFGIQLAFIDKNEIQFSIIYLPKLNEMYYSLKGNGTFLNHKKVIKRDSVDVNQSIVEFCGSLHKFYDEKKQIFENLLMCEGSVVNYIHINSCCVAFTNLLVGRTDALIVSTKKSWDILPGIMLCKEAGIFEFSIGNLKLYTSNIELAKLIINTQKKEC